MNYTKKNSPFQSIFYIAAFLSTAVYILWRAFFTMPLAYGKAAFILGFLLLLAEIAGYLESAWICRGAFHQKAARELPGEKAAPGFHDTVPGQDPLAEMAISSLPSQRWPHVDVLIATCQEPAGLLEKTIWGCKNMDYPDRKKVHIYLCDDGSRGEIRKLCAQMGVSYLSRSHREGAKAGNYNHALSLTGSPLIATFDSDMIPRHDFLTSLVPRFFGEDGAFPPDGAGCRTGFVQGPQSFYNHDLFQFHLYAESLVPNEQDFFFRCVQPMREKDNAVIYAGSNTILLRKAIEEAGGFYTESITEDLATGMLIQSHGYLGLASPHVCAQGLSPTGLSSLFKQRARWARGCIQTMRKLNPLTLKGLRPAQKISYLLSLTYWYTPFRRLLFLLAPICHAVFGIPLADCGFAGILFFWLPQAVLYHMALHHLCGGLRTFTLSNIYDTILCPGLIRPVLAETLGFSSLTFSITDKEKRQRPSREDRMTALCHGLFHSILLLLNTAGILRILSRGAISGLLPPKTAGLAEAAGPAEAAGLAAAADLAEAAGLAATAGRLEAAGPAEAADLFILLWLILNNYYLWMALIFIIGRTSHRRSDRIPVRLPGRLQIAGQTYPVEIQDLSESGAAFTLQSGLQAGTGSPSPDPGPSSPGSRRPRPSEHGKLLLSDESGRYRCALPLRIIRSQTHAAVLHYGAVFSNLEEADRHALYGILHDRIPPSQNARPRPLFLHPFPWRRSARKQG